MGPTKRGQVETPINWIFVLIAGTIILLFFGIVVFRIQNTSEKQSDATLITNLNSIIAGTELSSDTSILINDLPNIHAQFDCQGYTLGDLSGDYDQRLTFVPSHLNLNPLTIWTLDWSLPYFITNFVYVSNPKIRYILVYDETNFQSKSLKTRIDILFSKDITREYVTDLDSLTYNGEIGTKIIFLETDPSPLSDTYNDYEVDAVKINFNGLLSYYKKSQNQNDFTLTQNPISIYLDDATLLGAVIIDDINFYECMLNKAFDRYQQIAYIINQRVTSLKNSNSLFYCERYYTDGAEQLYSYLASTNYYNKKQNNELLSYKNDINACIQLLEQNNRDLPLRSCPTIY